MTNGTRVRATVYFALLISIAMSSAEGSQGCPAGAPVAPGATRTAAQPESEATLRKQISDQVADAWAKSDFVTLDSEAEQYIRTRAKTYSGKSRLSIFSCALSDQLQIDWPAAWYLPESGSCQCNMPDPGRYQEAEKRWDIVRTKVDSWIKQAPASPHADIALAQMFVNRAWFYRGTGFSITVPDEAWPLVSKYLAESQRVLTDKRARRVMDPQWFELMFFLAAAQSWNQEQVTSLILDFRENGQSYVPAYQNAANLMLPKWGGSYEALEEFAQQAVVDNGNDGPEIYARIYWSGVPALQYSQSSGNWPMMKRGFESMLRQFPDSRNLNGLAMYACGAGDGDTFKEAMSRLGPNLITPDTWTISLGQCVKQYGPVIFARP
jgi:hypothetical protein